MNTGSLRYPANLTGLCRSDPHPWPLRPREHCASKGAICQNDMSNLSSNNPPPDFCSVPHPGDSVFLPRGLRPACASPKVPCRGQLHSHQLVPRVARRCPGVRECSLPAGDRGHSGEAACTQMLASVPNMGVLQSGNDPGCRPELQHRGAPFQINQD